MRANAGAAAARMARRVDDQNIQADRRRRAFETNFRAALDEELGERLDEPTRARLTAALGAAHARTRHQIEARTTCRLFGKGVYLVLQAGLTRPRGGAFSRNLPPFAELLLARTEGIGVRFDEAELIAIGRAIGRAEITRRHPVDRRATLESRWLRGYVTFVAGRDRRLSAITPSHDRRAPERPTLGLLIFIGVVAVLSSLGAALILATFQGFATLMMEQPGRAALYEVFRSTLEAARR